MDFPFNIAFWDFHIWIIYTWISLSNIGIFNMLIFYFLIVIPAILHSIKMIFNYSNLNFLISVHSQVSSKQTGCFNEHFPPVMANSCNPCESLGINSNFPAKKMHSQWLMCTMKSRKPLPSIISICVFSKDLQIC